MNLNKQLNCKYLTETADICLLNMPVSSINIPALGLSVLNSILRKANFDTSVIYANLLFMERVGLTNWRKAYTLFSHSTNINEWLFSHCAFPDNQENVEEYFNLVIPELIALQKFYFGKCEFDEVIIKKELLSLRAMASKFIDDLAQLILIKKPKIVGCSSVGTQNLASLAILRKIKKIAPDVITIMGGPNCYGKMGIALVKNFPWVDFICSGEGDDVIVPLCKLLMSDTSTVNSELLPRGVFDRAKATLFEANGKLKDDTQLYNAASGFSAVSSPDFNDYFMTLKHMSYKKQIKTTLLLEASRGCWWGKCTFCALRGPIKLFRVKDYQLVLKEMQILSEKYKIKDIYFVDTILSMSHFKNLVPALASLRNKYNVFFEVKANLQEHHIKQLAKANVKWIQPGIEALNDDFLKLMNKGTSTVESLNFLKKTIENGMATEWMFLINFPEEKIEWLKTLAVELPLFHHLPPPMRITPIIFERYCHYYEYQDKYKLKLKPFPSFKFLYPIDIAELNDLCYYFYNEHYGLPTGQQIESLFSKYNFFVDAHLLWQQKWNKPGQEPILLMKEQGDCIEIIDTRDCAVAKKHSFNGIFAALLKLTDSHVHIDSIFQQLEKLYGEKYTNNDINNAITILKQKKVLYEHNKRLLNLAFKQKQKVISGQFLELQ